MHAFNIYNEILFFSHIEFREKFSNVKILYAVLCTNPITLKLLYTQIFRLRTLQIHLCTFNAIKETRKLELQNLNEIVTENAHPHARTPI